MIPAQFILSKGTCRSNPSCLIFNRYLHSGDRFIILNRTVDSFGTYLGDEDEEYIVQIAGEASCDPPIFHPSSLGNTSGPPAKMIITGIYMGTSTNVYEILIVEGIHVDEPLFTWRKYALGHRDGGGPYHHCKKLLSLSPIELEAGIFVSWNANSGQSSGDTWRFIAHAGDTFRWRRENSGWSPLNRITNVGLVMPDKNNMDLVNDSDESTPPSLRAFGEYGGLDDATLVVEILRDGDAFRWKKHRPPLDHNSFTTNHSGPHSYQNSIFDSNLLRALEKRHTNDYSHWSPAISLAFANPLHLMRAFTSFSPNQRDLNMVKYFTYL